MEELDRLLGYNDIAFLDDNVTGPSVVGKTADIGMLRNRFDTAIVALGNNEHRKCYHVELKRLNCTVPVLVHPTAFVSQDTEIGCGCIIRAHAVVSRYAKLGEGVIVNIGGLIDHHCEIGEFSMILPGAVVRGSAKVEAGSWIRANQVVE